MQNLLYLQQIFLYEYNYLILLSHNNLLFKDLILLLQHYANYFLFKEYDIELMRH